MCYVHWVSVDMSLQESLLNTIIFNALEGLLVTVATDVHANILHFVMYSALELCL